MFDLNAAGWGWFVDPTPADDSEFYSWDGFEIRPTGNQGKTNDIDLLTVLMHEIGHLLGYEHTDTGLMDDTLSAGVRETPTELVDQFFAAV